MPNYGLLARSHTAHRNMGILVFLHLESGGWRLARVRKKAAWPEGHGRYPELEVSGSERA